MKYKQKMQYVSCSDFSTQGHWPSGLFLLTCVSLLFFSACSQNYSSADNFNAGANASAAQKIQNFRSLENFRFIELEANKARALATKLDPSQQGLINWNGLRFALQQSLTNVSLKPAAGIALTVHAGNAGPVLNVSWGELRDSMLRMLELLPYLDENPGLLADEFRWLELAPEFGFTGYYEPTLLASHRPRPPYTFPLYSKPKDLRPDRVFYDRHAIDRQNILSGRRLELAWVRDELEVYFLQVQGSGRLLFPDGKTKHVLYAGKNGRPYVSLGAILRDKGLLDPDNISMSSIKNYLLEHPKEQAELLDMNPSYVFFRLAKAGPIGSMGSILTPKVSLAADPRVLPYGSVVFYSTSLPNQLGGHDREFNALGLPQDSGGAIKGRRIDIFCGAGEESEHIAGYLNNEGKVYLLLPIKNGSFTQQVK